MAKQKKVRNKKYNPQQAHAETARMVVENSLARISFIGASNRRIQPYGGRGFQFTVSRPVRVTVSAALAETLFEDPRTWSVWMAHYAVKADGAVDVESGVLRLDEYTLTDFTENVDKLVEHMKPEHMMNNPEYVGYAFFASPNERYDFTHDTTDERLIENFMASGVLEKENHLPQHVLNVTKEELIIMLMADHAKFDTNISIHQRGEGDDYQVANKQVIGE